MEPIRTIRSRTAVLALDNIDTDQIIPARFLKVTDKAGIGEHLFEDRPEFQVKKGSEILVAGDNFGCGSSREHAVWALKDFGFNADNAQVHLPALMEEAFGVSRSEARRLLSQGGVKLDGQELQALDVPAEELDGAVLQVGKRRFKRLRRGPA